VFQRGASRGIKGHLTIAFQATTAIAMAAWSTLLRSYVASYPTRSQSTRAAAPGMKQPYPSATAGPQEVRRPSMTGRLSADTSPCLLSCLLSTDRYFHQCGRAPIANLLIVATASACHRGTTIEPRVTIPQLGRALEDNDEAASRVEDGLLLYSHRGNGMFSAFFNSAIPLFLSRYPLPFWLMGLLARTILPGRLPRTCGRGSQRPDTYEAG